MSKSTLSTGSVLVLILVGLAGLIVVFQLVSGDPAERFVQVSDLDGEYVRPFVKDSTSTKVFVFVRDDCPISNRYAPELSRLHDEFAGRVEFALVYPNPDTTATAIRTHMKDYGLAMTAWRDEAHKLVRHSGVTITPEVAVYEGLDRVYRGRIDDRFPSFGVERAAPTTRDLHGVLTKLSAGEALEPYETEAVGCYIQDLKP